MTHILTMKNLKPIIILFLSSVLVLSCSNDENTSNLPESTLSQSNSENIFGSVSVNDIKPLISNLNDGKGNNLFDQNRKNTGQNEKGKHRWPIFDKENIIKMVDSTQAVSYAVYFIFEDTPETAFYNLVLKVLPDGSKSEPFILKFESDPEHFEDYRASNYDYGKFTGTIGLYKFVDFFPNYSILGKSECAGQHDAQGDPCNVDEVYNGTGSGGSATGGNNNGNKARACKTHSYWQHCGGSNTNQAHNAQSCGGPGGQGAGWVTTTDCGGGNDDNNGDTKTKKSVDCANCNVNATSGVNASSRTKALVGRLRYRLRLAQREGDYLLANPRLTEVVNSYVGIRGINSRTKLIVKNMIRSAISGNLISAAPFIKYPKNKAKEYKRKYPKLTEYLKNQLPKVANIKKITSAIHKFTKLPLHQIQKELKWGEGPELEIVQLDGYPDCSTCNEDVVGHFSKKNPEKILIDIDFVNKLESGNIDEMETDGDAFLFFLGTTILHEFVHNKEFNNKNFTFVGEEGVKYEIEVYGTNVSPENARWVLNQLK